MVTKKKFLAGNGRSEKLIRMSQMIALGRHFDLEPASETWRISSHPSFTEAQLKRVVVEFASELGFGRLVDQDTSASSDRKDRGDLLDVKTGAVIEVEHDWRHFLSHRHDPAKIDILVLAPGASPIPRAQRKFLPKRIIRLTDDHVRQWRQRTKPKRQKIAHAHKTNAAIHLLIELVTEDLEAELLRSEEDRQMPPEIYLEEELAELEVWGESCVAAFLKRSPAFLDRFIRGKIHKRDADRFWKYADDYLASSGPL